MTAGVTQHDCLSRRSRAVGHTGDLDSQRRPDPSPRRGFVERPLTGYGFQVVRGALSVPLQLLTAGGIVALAAYLTVLGGAAYTGLRFAADRALPSNVQATAMALVVSLIVWLIVGFVENNTFDRFIYAPVALILAISFASRHERVRRPPET